MADNDIEEESIIALLMATEKRPDGKVKYGGARRGQENSLGLRDGKRGCDGRAKGRCRRIERERKKATDTRGGKTSTGQRRAYKG
jgi:hypothetical protein